MGPNYLQYMQPPRRSDMMSDVMNVMAFKERKRDNDLTQQLLKTQENKKTKEEELEDMRFKSDIFLQGIEIKNQADRDAFFKLNNMNVNSSGPVIEMDGPENSIIRGPRDKLVELSILSAKGNVEAAKQFMLNAENQVIVEPKPPEDFEAALFDAYQKGDEAEVKNLLEMMGTMEGMGGDSAPTPEYAFLQSNQGIVSGDKRTGEVTLAKDENGQPFLSVSADPNILKEKEQVKAEVAAAADKEKKYPKVRDSLTTLKRKSGTVNKAIDKAINLIAPHTAGVGAWMKIIPATPQKTLHELLNTIRANIGFDALQEMRANSPTGGALGQVSEMENKLLQSVQGSLSQELSPSELAENLKTIKQNYAEMLKETGQAFLTDFNEFIPAQDAPGKDGALSADEYLKKNNFKGQ